MKTRRDFSLQLEVIALAAMLVLLCGTRAFALEHVIHNFLGSPDGSTPWGGLVADSAGNLYGTTVWGGTGPCAFSGAPPGCGTVFELSPPTGGSSEWTETVLYSFKAGDTDGFEPYGALIFDNQGNLYGTTERGGPNTYGTVFELSPPATPGGSWTETVLHIFLERSRGYIPAGGLAFDSRGSLYGTTFGGGNAKCGCGTVFRLSPPAAGQTSWRHSVLYSFNTAAGDAAQPGRGALLILNDAIYGVGENGGVDNEGGVYKLTTNGGGTWTETLLYSFNGDNGSVPLGGLIADEAGNLYGTVSSGGIPNCYGWCGTVYELSPPSAAGGSWQETTLYRFTGGRDGAHPYGALHRDRAGNLYGTTTIGGLSNKTTQNNGTIFELSPPVLAGGDWTETTLHEFGGTPYNDGSAPASELTRVGGTLYGTTLGGGTAGTVFSMVVSP